MQLFQYGDQVLLLFYWRVEGGGKGGARGWLEQGADAQLGVLLLQLLVLLLQFAVGFLELGVIVVVQVLKQLGQVLVLMLQLLYTLSV